MPSVQIVLQDVLLEYLMTCMPSHNYTVSEVYVPAYILQTEHTRYIWHAHLPEPFYPDEFEEAAIAVLQLDLHLTPNEITLDNAKRVYTHLLNILSV